MRLRSGTLAPLLFTLAFASVASAQDQKKFLEEERRKEMDARPPRDEDMKQPVLWDAGGWLHAQVDYLQDPPFRDTRTDRYIDLRLWGQLRIEDHYTGYVRIQTDYTDFNEGDQFKSSKSNQFRAPHMDQAWVEGNWTDEDRGFSIRAGREFISIGSGLLFNDVAYAIQATYDWERIAVRGFLAHSLIHEDDIDQSIPKPGDSHRVFFGVEADYLITGSHRAYAMFLLEHDLNRENNPFQDWDYNANYFGLGALGTIVGAGATRPRRCWSSARPRAQGPPRRTPSRRSRCCS